MKLAARTAAISGSQTSRSRNRARELVRGGIDIVNLAAGELDRTPPDLVLDTLRTLSADVNRYTDTAGIPELRDAIAHRMSTRVRAHISREDIVVTTGAKQALFLTAMTLFGPGDSVLVPTPAWGTLAAQITLADANATFVDTGPSGFIPDIELLERHRTASTRGILLNTPNNPTGVVYSSDVVERIVRWSEENDLWIVFDESYADLVFPPAAHVHPLQVRANSANRVVTVGSFSKSFAVTGWRVGWLVGPERLIKQAKALQSHLTSHAPSVLQHALLPAALGAADDFVAESVLMQMNRLAIAERELAKTPYLHWHHPGGTFYLWVDCRQVMGRQYGGYVLGDDLLLGDQLLEHANVACVAGSAFGSPGFLRLSLTVDETRLAKALGEVRRFFRNVG